MTSLIRRVCTSSRGLVHTGMMECLHGKPASSSTTKKGSFWFCGEKPSCEFICTEDEGYAFQKAITAWKNTNVKQPVCKHIVDQRNFVLLKTYRKRATEDHICDPLRENIRYNGLA